MKVNRVRVVGLVTVVLIILLFSMLVVMYEFPAFDYADPSSELIEVETTVIGLEVSRFLWTYRLVDLIAQAFVLFAAATCCMAILRQEEEKK